MTIWEAVGQVFDNVRIQIQKGDVVLHSSAWYNEPFSFDQLKRLSELLGTTKIDIRSSSGYYGEAFTWIIIRGMAERFEKEEVKP